MVAKEPTASRDLGSRIRRRGLMLVLSSPSGAGKSTIARNLLESDSSLELSVSVTTRPRRGSEIEGVHYLFRTMREFERLRDSDALLEWAEVHGNFYATPREPAEAALAEGRDMLFDIDWQGAQQLKEKMRADIVSIFILPPSMKELKARLKRRAEDQEQVIETRLKNARVEIEHWKEYDFVIVNDDLDRAFAEVRAIVTAERLRRDRRPGLFDFISGLLDEKTE
ncbi:guanylate kinase [Mesorhizobium sp. M1A.F.Ca.IN.022.07.1.1]|uniref:guanylate kinase n=1 Tax=unclassified Mesorhizobium TaxID=325217 RepID=UPI000F76185F|nr:MULTISPECIES: guanylate kinase [unclassified Mesorhizobium]TGV91784.1 guanylate kinase [Mesorhizobium sp. M00.F.Ca.ET.158.01.1.1]AZO58785.1 guanylate kinase [Mesorhizobium sp. M1A.F.Ca.IN.022.06.1.1]MCT2578907.1 guanylate kinase [Mesorhizobium sp. P13.3]MDF3167847.1 guanylate kinase [Mesorhizobium sp. P16.1]MDF3178269.1 guanylate kinase [Mesorhizobium sp. P17.1]